MSRCRFLYNNLIVSETMLAVSSLRMGIITAALKEGVGSAILNPSGSYTGATDKEYVVEIESIAAGAEVGQATFRWSDGGGAWDGTNRTTSASDLLLNSGVYINFSSGSGADFAVGDKWYFKGINLFHGGKMVDNDRDHRYRSAILEAPNTITITLTSAQAADVLVLYDHNLTSAATIVLKGHTADSWGTPDFTETITPWNADKIVQYIAATPRTFQYWQVQITDAANPDGYIEIGELFLGSYLELSRNYTEGFSEETNFLMDTNRTPYGVERDRFYNAQKTFSFDFDAMLLADVTSMKTLIAAIGSRSTGVFKPLWFNKDSATPYETWLVKLASLPVSHWTGSFYNMSLEFKEVLTST